MEDIKERVTKWRDIATQRKNAAIKKGDRMEVNYQLGKRDLCNEMLKDIENGIKAKKTKSKTGDKQSVQSTKADH
jgi:hypothetical protein